MASTSTRIRAQLHAPPTYLPHVSTVAELAGLRPTPTAGVALLVADRDEPAMTDRWAVDSLPHLVVRLGAGSVRVGPFVHPGVTACLHCLTVGGLVVDSRPAAYGDVDPALMSIALAWAVRDLATWQAGGLPTTWSTTVLLGADLRPEVTRWPRHPHCGCSWGLGVDVG
ncbi:MULTISPECIES: hypothetical protein [Nocardioides]|uniref:hypothetical protein n=1 Tax=Nocardioides TaxID=1839 RepID=UPI00032EBCCB|nr:MULTISPECIES: hypothetical protein [Nocardioides]EON24681.1 hypothetical protein CF8_1255 [Nocardioides sp. CF8]